METTKKVPQGAPNQWMLKSTVDKNGIEFGMTNPDMGLEVAYEAVYKADGVTVSHCQFFLYHNGGVIGVPVSSDYKLIGYTPNEKRRQGEYDAFPRGFKDISKFGAVEVSEVALRREMAESDEANAMIRTCWPLAKSVNVDNALTVHPNPGGNDFYVVSFPVEDFEPAGEGVWRLKSTVTVDGKFSKLIFIEVDKFLPQDHGAGLDGFTLMGLMLYKEWLRENVGVSVSKALEIMKNAVRAELKKF